MSDTKLCEAQGLTTPPQRLIQLAGMSIELARAVATNPNAPPKLLHKLSKYDDLETRRNVAGNPNAATDILFKLGKDFPEEFLNNPILGLWILENPNLASIIPNDTMIELLKQNNVPQVFVEYALTAPILSHNINWRLAVASNPSTTKEVLVKLYKQFPKTNIAQAALLHVHWRGEITSYWHEAAFIEIRTCGYISRNEVKDKLLQELGIIPKLLRPYSTRYRPIVSLYKHSISTYKYINTLNKLPLLSPIVDKIIKNLNKINQKIDTSTFITSFFLVPFVLSLPFLAIVFIVDFCLINRKKSLIGLFIFILFAIIFPSFTISLIKFLLLFTLLTCLILIAGTVGGLVATTAIFIGFFLIGLMIILLANIINQLFYLFQNHNQNTLKSENKYRHSSNIFKQDLEAAINPNTSSTILFELASSRWLAVREAVAANLNADAEVLKKLAKDETPRLQILVAKHLNTPAEVFVEFAQSNYIDKKLVAARNSKTPLATLKYLARSSKKYETVSSEAIKTIAQHYPEELTNILVEYVEKTPLPSAARLFLLLHPTAPSDFLARHYRSLDWRERYAVAQNPNTSFIILEKLMFDANCIVRATAKARF